jgi:D-amino peptidase
MRLYISVDMEGVSGVTRWQDVSSTGQDYPRARSWMTADVNAAVAGARRAGATEFVVEENHGVEMLCNLVLDEIDADVEVVRGQPRGGATTAAALDESCDALMLVGHHAKVRDYPGVCAHTISYGDYTDVRMNGRTISEGEIFATIAAQHGVPTVLIAGDDVICAEMQKVAPGIETAGVKRALSRTAAAILPPARAQRIIASAAQLAIERLRAGEITAADFAPPFSFEIELRSPLSEDARAVIGDRFPEFTVTDDKTVAFEHSEMAVAYRMAAITQFLARQPHDIRSY